MKTLKMQGTEKKVEYLRVKDGEERAKVVEGWKLCGKVEWKTATQGYGGKKEKAEVVKKEEDVTAGIPKKRYSKPSKS